MATTNKYDKLIAEYDKHCQRIAQISIVNINEAPKDKALRIGKLESDYITWFEYYFPNYASVKSAWFHKKLAKAIISNKQIKALAELYRSAGKSVHIDMGIPLYLQLVKNEMKFMLLVGETDKKAKQLLSGIQAQIQYNKRIINDYGSRFQYGDWANGDFTTTDGVKFLSYGFGQNPRGAREQERRPDYIVVDDVDSKKHVNNDTLMREAVDFITEDIWGCFDSNDNAIERFVYANNNFHKNSITNRFKLYLKSAIKQAEDNKETHNFYIITVPAVKNTNDFTPNWPEKTSADYWRKKFNSTPYRSFMREYMHVHIQDGAVFSYDDVQYCSPLPLSKYDGLVFYGDLSYKQQGDYKAMLLIGKVGREYHVLHSYLRKGSRAKCAEWLYNIYEREKLERFNIKYLVEGLFAMDEFVNDFDTEGDKRGYHISVVADKRSKANKFDRVESLAGIWERRNFFFNDNEKLLADTITLIDQFLAFEKGSQANDDGPDAAHGAVSELNKVTFVDKFPVKTTSRTAMIAKSKNRY